MHLHIQDFLNQCWGSGMFIRDLGSWFLPIPDPWSRIPDLGSRTSDPGPRIPDLGSRISDPRSRNPDLGSRIPDPGYRIPDPGYRIPDPESRIQDPKTATKERGEKKLGQKGTGSRIRIRNTVLNIQKNVQECVLLLFLMLTNCRRFTALQRNWTWTDHVDCNTAFASSFLNLNIQFLWSLI